MKALRKRYLIGGIILMPIAFVIGQVPRSLHYRSIAATHHAAVFSMAIMESEETLQRKASLIQWHEQMERKYRHAALFPWRPVEPDAPQPVIPPPP